VDIMPEHTLADRRADSEHVLYEIEMLCQLAAYFESRAIDRAVAHLDQNGIVVRNALIEAFQVHARQLIDFLTSSPGNADKRDVYAWQFTKARWTADRQAHQADWERFSQRVMHLSLRRATLTDEQRKVETRRIRRALGADIERFLDAVDQELVCQGFVAQARDALRFSEPPADAPLTAPVVGATESLGPLTISTTGALYTGGTAVKL
jgi:hypothetical protein